MGPAAALWLAAAAPAVAQQTQPSPPAPAILNPDAALAEDAAEYARQMGVGQEEAVARLRAQQDSVAATDALAAEFEPRLAGIAIEHRPDWHVQLLLTGGEPVADRMIEARGRPVPVRFRTGAPATRARLLEALRTHQAAIRAMMPAPPGLGVDQREGVLVVTADADGVAPDAVPNLEQRIAALAGVPVRVRLLGAAADARVDGGSRVEGVSGEDGRRYACTTGFVVTDGARTAIVTAAHCPDALTYYDPAGRETPLQFLGQWGWGFRDVQLHVGDAQLGPTFFSDAARTRLRPLAGGRNRSSTRAGDFVCHRGERSGYGCSLIEMVDYAPPGDLCGGPCLPTWVSVAGPVCRGGDSGGPVFSGTVAYGILKGATYRRDGRCLFYYYMSTDYLPEGWRLLRAQ